MKFDDLLNEIKGCLNDKHYLAALSLALSIPDVCGSVEYSNITAVSQRYKEWYKNHIGKNENLLNMVNDCEDYPWIDEDIVYSIRCNMFHEGFPKVNTSQVKRDINKSDVFYLALYESNRFSSNDADLIVNDEEWTIKKKTMINVSYLCNLLVDAGELFYKNNKEKFKVDNSMEDYYSTGIFKINFIK